MVRARCDAELPPIITIVWHPGRPVISVPEGSLLAIAIRGSGIAMADRGGSHEERALRDISLSWETDFYTPPVLGGVTFFFTIQGQ